MSDAQVMAVAEYKLEDGTVKERKFSRRQFSLGNMRGPVELAGKFHCELTTSEQNEWREFLMNHPARATNNRIVAEYSFHANNPCSLADMTCTVQALELSEDELYRTAKQWYADVILPRIAAEETES